MRSLPSFFPLPLFLLTPLTGVESYQTKWHLRDWLGSFSHLCLEMVECPSRLIGSRWQLLPPIGLTGGLPNMTSWFLGDAGSPLHIINQISAPWVRSHSFARFSAFPFTFFCPVTLLFISSIACNYTKTCFILRFHSSVSRQKLRVQHER